jgi:hypothetical protein
MSNEELPEPLEPSWKRWRRKNRLKYNAYLREYLDRNGNRAKHNKLNLECYHRRKKRLNEALPI